MLLIVVVPGELIAFWHGTWCTKFREATFVKYLSPSVPKRWTPAHKPPPTTRTTPPRRLWGCWGLSEIASDRRPRKVHSRRGPGGPRTSRRPPQPERHILHLVSSEVPGTFSASDLSLRNLKGCYQTSLGFAFGSYKSIPVSPMAFRISKPKPHFHRQDILVLGTCCPWN